MKQRLDTSGDLVQIGVLAERVGLSLRTVRYYEEIGLLEPAARTTGGFRLYAPEQEKRQVLLEQVKATEQITRALDAAARGLT